jgi:hypothetical protein
MSIECHFSVLSSLHFVRPQASPCSSTPSCPRRPATSCTPTRPAVGQAVSKGMQEWERESDAADVAVGRAQPGIVRLVVHSTPVARSAHQLLRPALHQQPHSRRECCHGPRAALGLAQHAYDLGLRLPGSARMQSGPSCLSLNCSMHVRLPAVPPDRAAAGAAQRDGGRQRGQRGRHRPADGQRRRGWHPNRHNGPHHLDPSHLGQRIVLCRAARLQAWDVSMRMCRRERAMW